jgi:hypothetical protein
MEGAKTEDEASEVVSGFVHRLVQGGRARWAYLGEWCWTEGRNKAGWHGARALQEPYRVAIGPLVTDRHPDSKHRGNRRTSDTVHQ